jgi:hypothetical protein
MLAKEIRWVFNTPAASHHGGVWERLIRSTRKIFQALSTGCQFTMDDEQLVTLLCIVESIINSRPITNNPDDCRDCEALTPNHLLLLRNGPQALGSFESSDLYGRRWRQVQCIASEFWKRWLREYIPSLQIRNKCHNPERNIEVDDLVLFVIEQTQRSVWPLGRIIEVIKGRDGLVRTVKVKTPQRILTRPVTKIVLLEHID